MSDQRNALPQWMTQMGESKLGSKNGLSPKVTQAQIPRLAEVKSCTVPKFVCVEPLCAMQF